MPGVFPDSGLDGAVRAALGEAVGRRALGRLRELDASSRGIRCLSGLERLTGLAILDLGDNQIERFEPLASLGCLRSLELRDNPGLDFSPLGKLRELRELSLGGYWEDDDVGSLTLEAFGPAWGPTLTSLRPLRRLTKLRRLELWHHEVRNLSPLRDLVQLRRLSLARAGGERLVGDFSPLSGLPELRRLELRGNRIRSDELDVLSRLSRLVLLDLRDNGLEDVGGLLRIPEWGRDACVDLRDNPLGERALGEQVALLRAKGLRVLTDGAVGPSLAGRRP